MRETKIIGGEKKMVTGPNMIGRETKIDPQEKLIMDSVTFLIEEKLNGMAPGKNCYVLDIAHIVIIPQRVLAYIKTAYRAVGWKEVEITEEPRSYQATEGVDPHFYKVKLVKNMQDQELIEILEKEIKEKIQIQGAGEDEYRIKFMPFPRRMTESVIKAVEELFEKDGKYSAKITENKPSLADHASIWTIVLKLK